MSLINTTTRAEFEQHVINNDKVVLVDFWATWCPPCRAMAPVLESMSKKHDTKLDVVKVDVEASADNNRLAGEHGVQGIPNLQIYKGGKVVGTIIGYTPEPGLMAQLEPHF